MEFYSEGLVFLVFLFFFFSDKLAIQIFPDHDTSTLTCIEHDLIRFVQSGMQFAYLSSAQKKIISNYQNLKHFSH